MDDCDVHSQSLHQFLHSEGLVPSPENQEKRENVIQKLNEIVLAWIKKVAWQRHLPKEQIAATSAALMTYGSYCLGVHNPDSDIDILCVGPSFATMVVHLSQYSGPFYGKIYVLLDIKLDLSMQDDFFIVLYNMLKSRQEVSEIHCVKGAKLPLISFTCDGISVDLPYVQLKVLSVPENADILDPIFLSDIDGLSVKSLSGVCANRCILQIVPQAELFGFLGGIHLAILAAFVCQRHSNASLSVLVSEFFKTFAFWPWPSPVILYDEMMPEIGVATEKPLLMPIQLPHTYEYCHSNITRSTFYKIRAEFLRGHNMTKDLSKQGFSWRIIFEHFQYLKTYARFIRIYLSTSSGDELGDWVGRIKSRFPFLLQRLEQLQTQCDPNPTQFMDVDVVEPNIIFYWGLRPGRTNVLNLRSVGDVFIKNACEGYQGSRGSFALSIVQASQISKSLQSNSNISERVKPCWRISDYNQRRIPVFSQHLPGYLVGYVADAEY